MMSSPSAFNVIIFDISCVSFLQIFLHRILTKIVSSFLYLGTLNSVGGFVVGDEVLCLVPPTRVLSQSHIEISEPRTSPGTPAWLALLALCSAIGSGSAQESRVRLYASCALCCSCDILLWPQPPLHLSPSLICFRFASHLSDTKQ